MFDPRSFQSADAAKLLAQCYLVAVPFECPFDLQAKSKPSRLAHGLRNLAQDYLLVLFLSGQLAQSYWFSCKPRGRI
jgi:hypothetical protein